MPARSFCSLNGSRVPSDLITRGITQLGGLEGGEALVTAQALPAPTHLPAVRDQTRVDHLGVLSGAERTIHERTS